MDVVNSKDVALWDMPADGDVPLCHWATSTLKNALSILFRLKDLILLSTNLRL